MKDTDKILVYDDACPLCVAYTSAFVKTGLLTTQGRKPFSEASPELLHAINWQRSKNEIPLLDLKNNRILYGIDALLEILGSKCGLVKNIGMCKPVNWLLRKLYNFISYNRKVIVAAKTPASKIDCTPSFNLFYRVAFMAVFLLFNTIMLYPLHRQLLSQMPLYSLSANRLLLLHFILVAINCTLATFLPKRAAVEYLGQVNMLALVTILLLIPLLITNSFIHIGSLANYMYLGLLTLVIIKEYFRRMDYANILRRYRLIVVINFVCVITLCICVFTSVNA
jgi:predicted DCC family thiol-disulfide oxidoreductase YuxK